MARNQKDYYYFKAHVEGYRSRASYKLKQINEREHIIKRNDNVVDLGSAPGGWLQVARELSNGIIIGVDIKKINPMENVTTIIGDIRDPNIIRKISLESKGYTDVVICDAAPNLTGNWIIDHSRGIELNESALNCAIQLLKKNGKFIVKVFQGELFQEYYNKLKNYFGYVRAYSPSASRSKSSEIYIICKYYFGFNIDMNKIYSMKIESIDENNYGIGYINNKKIFIKDVEKNKIYDIKVKKIRSKYIIAKKVEYLNIVQNKEETDLENDEYDIAY